MDWFDREHLPLTVLMLAAFAAAILSEVGFRLGWWNDSHTLATFVSLAVAVLVGAANYLLGATRRQVRTTGDAIVAEVRAVRGDVQRMQGAIVAHQEEQTGLLRAILDSLRRGGPQT